MKRRQFLALVGGVTASPFAARAQTPSKPLRIGMVHPASPNGVPPKYVEFIDRLPELGYVEGDTLAVE
jgi:hypothetical protein